MRGGPRSSYVAVLACRLAPLPVQPVRAARAPLRGLRQPRHPYAFGILKQWLPAPSFRYVGAQRPYASAAKALTATHASFSRRRLYLLSLLSAVQNGWAFLSWKALVYISVG